MSKYYPSVMDFLYRVSMWITGIALLVMAAIILIDMFVRYILNNTLSWLESVATLCTVTFTFIDTAVSYRTGSYIAVSMVTGRLGDASHRYCSIVADIMLVVINLFTLWHGTSLCLELQGRPVAEFPLLNAGQNYLPLPIGSVITLLFIAEKIFRGPQYQRLVVMLGSISQLPSPFQKGKQMDAFILVFTLGIMPAIRVLVAYAASINAIIGAWCINTSLETVMIQLTSGVNKFLLLVIPLFILAGAIVTEGGITRRLMNFIYIFVGFIHGGLSLVNVAAPTFFGAISGLSVADAVSISLVMVPKMDRKGCPRDFAVAVTTSSSVQAILTPPSHSSVIYSLTTDGTVSTATLFIAGILSGLLLSLSPTMMCVASAHKRGYPKGERVPFRQASKIFVDTLWGLMAAVIIMDGTLSGIFTATESVAVAYLRAFFVTVFIYRDYKWSELLKLMFRTMKAATIVIILIGPAVAFGTVMTHMQLSICITETFTSISGSKCVVLICINIMLLLIGTLMSMASPTLVLTPALLPVTSALDIGPARFGMIMLVNLGIGLITPPVGSVLFVASVMSKQKIEQVVKVMLPSYLVLFLVLMFMTYIPAISLLLSKLFGVV